MTPTIQHSHNKQFDKQLVSIFRKSVLMCIIIKSHYSLIDTHSLMDFRHRYKCQSIYRHSINSKIMNTLKLALFVYCLLPFTCPLKCSIVVQVVVGRQAFQGFNGPVVDTIGKRVGFDCLQNQIKHRIFLHRFYLCKPVPTLYLCLPQNSAAPFWFDHSKYFGILIVSNAIKGTGDYHNSCF